MILLLLNLVLALAQALVLVLALGLIAVRHQRLFLTLFMLLTAFESTRDFAPPNLAMTLSGISVYPEDLVSVLGACAALARIRHWRLRGIPRTSALVLVVLVGSGVIIWIPAFDMQKGVSFWRQDMLILALLLYTTTRSRAWSWSDLRVIIVWSAIVVALASLVGTVSYGFGSSSSAVEIGGVMEGGRPASASGSLIMLVGLWVTIFSVGKWTATRILTILLLGGMVLVTQNRSVWVAAILSVVVWWLVPRIRPRGTSGGLGGVNRTIVVFFVAVSTALVGLSVNAVRISAGNDQTWLWRLDRWADSMSIPRSWVEWFAGSALGPTPAAAPGLFPAHSLYVITIEQTGFIGLAAVVCLLVFVGKARFPPAVDSFGLVVCFILLSYGVAYPLPPWTWMLAGILLVSTKIEQPGDSPDFARVRVADLTRPERPEEPVANRARL